MKSLFVILMLSVVAGCAHDPFRHSWKGDISPVRAALTRLSHETDGPVSVAVYGEARFLQTDSEAIRGGIDPGRWADARRNQIQTSLEQQILEYMAAAKNFHIVDRMTLNKVMEELAFSLSGALSKGVRVRIGELTGANHLILFESSYYPGNSVHVVTVRLIGLESGEVLASQSTVEKR